MSDLEQWHALLQVCTREPSRRQRLAAVALIFLRAIEPLQIYEVWKFNMLEETGLMYGLHSLGTFGMSPLGTASYLGVTVSRVRRVSGSLLRVFIVNMCVHG